MPTEPHLRDAYRARPQPPAGTSEPLFQLPRPVLALILLLVFFHFVPGVFIRDWEGWSTLLFAFIPARLSGAQTIAQVSGSAYWSMLTYGFLHADSLHLAVNSLWLAVFGTPVARCFGTLRFILISALATIGGAVASLLVHWGEYIILVGASGAVSGLVGASVPVIFAAGSIDRFSRAAKGAQLNVLPFAALMRNQRALWFLAIWLFMTFFTGTTQLIVPTALLEGRVIAWEAHLGGFLVGFACAYIFAPLSVSQAKRV